MLIPDEIRKCVAFLMYRDATRFKFAGTCFFVATPLSEDPKKPNFMYIVTAAHVIRVMKEKSVDGKAYVRLNFPDSTVKVSPTPLEAWLSHPTDPTVDIAVLPRKPPPGADYLVYPMDRFATEDAISKEGIGLGEEVFVVGLFHEHVGKKRNIPIIRVGNIAAMPEEPVQVRGVGAMEAYLVEARSLGGLSGSPVFVNLGFVRNVSGQVKFASGGSGIFYLLGLMHGHWDRLVPVTLASDEIQVESVNMGIAIVAPAKKILEVINQPGMTNKEVSDQNGVSA